MMQLVIVTGLSGSGKSIVLRALEDLGFYCIDNLPATLLLNISHHLDVDTHERVAISVDTRSVGLEVLPDNIQALKSQGIYVQVLFLEANVDTLVKRYSETRRRHPLSKDNMTLAESIVMERELLSSLVDLGHHIDTTNLSANALRTLVRDFVAHDAHDEGITLQFTSFGFKHGIPLDADYVFDVRCLPNPYYDVALRPYTGKDAPVREFLAAQPLCNDMFETIQTFVERWLPHFVRDHRSYLTIAIGCTGGQHRSVYLVEILAKYFAEHAQRVIIRHRELEVKS